MSAYALAHLRHVAVGPEIVRYVQRIDATLEPFEGRFLVHGGKVEVVEGTWPGDLVVIAFPDLAHARDWYSSPAYQEILGLRTGNAEGDVIFVEGVSGAHRAIDILAGLVGSGGR